MVFIAEPVCSGLSPPPPRMLALRSNARASDGADAEKPRTKPNGRQGAGFDLFVDLFAADEPILSQFRHGDVRFRMRLKVLDRHVTSKSVYRRPRYTTRSITVQNNSRPFGIRRAS